MNECRLFLIQYICLYVDSIFAHSCRLLCYCNTSFDCTSSNRGSSRKKNRKNIFSDIVQRIILGDSETCETKKNFCCCHARVDTVCCRIWSPCHTVKSGNFTQRANFCTLGNFCRHRIFFYRFLPIDKHGYSNQFHQIKTFLDFESLKKMLKQFQ